jgi:hypothetical protein
MLFIILLLIPIIGIFIVSKGLSFAVLSIGFKLGLYSNITLILLLFFIAFLFLFLFKQIFKPYINTVPGKAVFMLIRCLEFVLKCMLFLTIAFFVRICIISIFNIYTYIYYLDLILLGITTAVFGEIGSFIKIYTDIPYKIFNMETYKNIFNIITKIKNYNKMHAGLGDNSSDLNTYSSKNNSIPKINSLTFKGSDNGNTSPLDNFIEDNNYTVGNNTDVNSSTGGNNSNTANVNSSTDGNNSNTNRVNSSPNDNTPATVNPADLHSESYF